MLLLSALATKRVLPSGEMTSASGVLPSGGSREEGGVNRLGHDPSPSVDDRDPVARGARHEDPVVGRGDGDLVGMVANGDPGNGAEIGGVDHSHSPAGPVGYEELVAATREGDVVRPGAGRRGFEFLVVVEVEGRDGSGVDIQ